MGEKQGHTPGPWVARRMHTGGYDIFDPRERDVVTIYGGGVETESREANARLIAAAPDLLAAAQVVLAGLHARIDAADLSAVPVFSGIAELHDAISRATGEDSPANEGEV